MNKGKAISFLQAGKSVTWFLVSIVFIFRRDKTIYRFFFIVY